MSWLYENHNTMKKFNIPSKGFVATNEDFGHLYQTVKDLYDNFAGLLAESSAPIRVFGVEWTVNGQDYACTEGYILYSDTIYKVDAFSGTATGSQVPVFNVVKTPLVHEPHDLYEGYDKVGSFTITEEERLVPSFNASGTGLFDWDHIVKNPLARNTEAIFGLQGLKPGMIVDFYGQLTNFDATGMGIGDMIGFALCNGQNNTPDLRGRVTVGLADPSTPNGNTEANLSEYFEIGNHGGERSVGLTTSQLPKHTPSGKVTNKTVEIEVTKGGVGLGTNYVEMESTDTGGSGNVAAMNWSQPTLGNDLGWEAEMASDGLTMDEIGNDENHENRQPFMVLGKVMKL